MSVKVFGNFFFLQMFVGLGVGDFTLCISESKSVYFYFESYSLVGNIKII